MNQARRLDRVEATLTPKQVVVLWLREAQPFPDVCEYVRSMRDQPESARPVPRMCRQVEDAIRKEMKGQRPEVIEPAVRRAVRDVVFLVRLRNRVNFYAASEQHSRNLMRLVLAERLHSMIQEGMYRDMCQWQAKGDQEAEMLQDWKLAAATFLIELYVFRDAVAHIEKRYVDGLPLLFPDVARDLAKVVGDTEQLVDLFNGTFGKMDPNVVVGLEAVRGNALKQAPEKITYLVDMAKADALEEMGEREASIELAGRYL